MNNKISPLFSLLWPVIIISTFYSLGVPFFEPFINLPLLFVLILTADICAYYLYVSTKKMGHKSFFKLLRFLICFLLPAWGLYKMTSGEFIQKRYTPFTIGSLTTIICCSVGWYMTIFFSQAILIRKELLIKLTPFKNEKLAAHTRQFSYELQELKCLTRKIRLFPALFTTFSLMIFWGETFHKGLPYPYQTVILLILLFFTILFLFHTREQDEERVLLTKGIQLKEEWLIKKRKRFLLLLLLLSLPALLLSRSDLHLPFSLIETLLNRIAILLPHERLKTYQPIEIPQIEWNQKAVHPSLPLALFESAANSVILSDNLKELILQILIGIGLGGLLLFLLYPLFKKDNSYKDINMCRKVWEDLQLFLCRSARGFIRRKKKKRNQQFLSQFHYLDKKEKNLPYTPGTKRVKLPSTGKVLKVFNRLCHFGKKRGIPYKKGTCPSAYIEKLCKILPNRKKELNQIARFLESYFYSASLIKEEEIDIFTQQTLTMIREEK
jgi:hypothetical protein